MQKRIGMLGGGQLGRMFLQNAYNYPVEVRILDPNPSAPCAGMVKDFVVGDFADYDTVMAFGQDCDIITIEIEAVNTDALKALEKEGKTVIPGAHAVATIKNKVSQKIFFEANGLPVSAYHTIANKTELEIALQSQGGVFKVAEGGYDGRGVWFMEQGTTEDLPNAEGLLESVVEIDKELAVLVVRNANGEVVAFDPIEQVFHSGANLLDYLKAPADISLELKERAKGIAKKAATSLDFVGLLAVELFLTKSGELLLNEVAPRPHNSGHHTIEACVCSQYDQLLRVLLDLPLGSTEQLKPAGIVNLLGGEHLGAAQVSGWGQLAAIEDAYFHWYGKTESKPMRKMGHISVLADSPSELIEKIEKVKGTVSVNGDGKV